MRVNHNEGEKSQNTDSSDKSLVTMSNCIILNLVFLLGITLILYYILKEK